jgi:hypothetical protein
MVLREKVVIDYFWGLTCKKERIDAVAGLTITQGQDN